MQRRLRYGWKERDHRPTLHPAPSLRSLGLSIAFTAPLLAPATPLDTYPPHKPPLNAGQRRSGMTDASQVDHPSRRAAMVGCSAAFFHHLPVIGSECPRSAAFLSYALCQRRPGALPRNPRSAKSVTVEKNYSTDGHIALRLLNRLVRCRREQPKRYDPPEGSNKSMKTSLLLRAIDRTAVIGRAIGAT